ncbi:hypothetical protein [Cupriavidus sp. AU9028]|uniref:hypothetical protein n=1 Tax=Cupriavidus sp. AU9028 TaxID=2871157 RepID=UPI001C9648F6|nr:hypothetical protein [Cupriavidus sp. AU9028]MBY4896340.1 hypothetical protein [Cupriavidus sp. AU9028]
MSEGGSRRSDPEPRYSIRCLPRPWLAAIGLCELSAVALLLLAAWEGRVAGEPLALLWAGCGLAGVCWLVVEGRRIWKEADWRYLGLGSRAPGSKSRCAIRVVDGVVDGARVHDAAVIAAWRLAPATTLLRISPTREASAGHMPVRLVLVRGDDAGHRALVRAWRESASRRSVRHSDAVRVAR